MYAAIAINAALTERERTGQGRTIDISMLDCQLAMLSYQSTYALVAGITPQPQGARHDSIPTYRSFLAGDGRELVVTANTDRMWKGLCVALDREALTTDDRFLSGSSRLSNREALWPLLEEAFLARPAADWIEPLQREGVPVALIKNVPEALNDARAAGRGMVMPLRDAAGDTIEVVGNPIKFSGEAESPATYPPRLGADAGHVLDTWLKMAPGDVQALAERGVLTNPPH
jgi:crotonobetainyl-CoA:carnitine CoA-transferase CaiB-like acyl-CoA transferase